MASEMAKKLRSAERQVHPDGERITVDDRFRDRVRAKLEKEDMSMRDLAGQISVQPASISNLLAHTGRHQYRIVTRIVKLWKWQYVIDDNVLVVVDNAEAHKRITRGLSQLDEAGAELVAQLIEQLAIKKR
jgi:hypothetical protein